MNKLTPKDQKAKEIAAIETALAETRADIAAGRVVKESAAAHVKRVKRCALASMGKEKGNALGGAPEDDWEASFLMLVGKNSGDSGAHDNSYESGGIPG